MKIELPTAENPVVIIEGDCLEVLPHIPAGVVDLVLTDPPYGILAESGSAATRRSGGNSDDGKMEWDVIPDMGSVLAASSKAMIWGGCHMPLAPTFGYLIWDKQIDGLNFGEVEYCWTTEKFAPRIFRYRAVGVDGGKLHPTQKPIALMRWCIQKAKVPRDGLILDPFAGSGTTAIAAILEGRRCILIEKDARYVEIARQRVAKALCLDKDNLFRETEQAALFEAAA